MTQRTTLIAVVVATAVATAVFGATAALRLISGGAFGPGGRPLSEADVRRAFNSGSGTPVTSPSPSRPASSASGPPAVSGRRLAAFASAGGNVYAVCASGQAAVSRWIPAVGYSTDGYLLGPASVAWMRFKSASAEVTVTVSCVAGRPHFTESSDDRGGGHGGDNGGGGGTSGGGGGRGRGGSGH